jgi:5-(hydroxymethyl)furfural/furfural oxidase
MSEPVDCVIVGGGSAGCVLAARLSEDPGRRVLLVEAGRDVTRETASAAILSPYPAQAYFDPANIWPGISTLMGGAGLNDPAARPRMNYSLARLMGGGSSINGLGANRGAPSDFDEWADAGAEGWAFADVLPYFRKLERDLDLLAGEALDEALHGRDGPLPIRRVRDRPGFTRAVVAELVRRGYPERPDQNGAWADGVFPITTMLDEGWRRVSTAIGYLTPEVRRRANLRIRPDTAVARILLDGRRATGVELVSGERVLAREVISCSGAVGSPALLMRSGIGPGEALAAAGIEVRHGLRGVGRNLMEHPSSGVAAYLPRGQRMPRAPAYHIPVNLRFSSGVDGAPAGDMHMAVVNRAAWHGVGRRTSVLFVWVNKSYSRGEVRLAGPDPQAPPVVDFRLLSDARDRTRLADAVRLAASVLSAPGLEGACQTPMLGRMSDRAKTFGAPTLRNRLLMALAGLGLDLAGARGGRLLERMNGAGPPLADLLADEAALDAALDESVSGVWHASGTCRMGRDGDPLAVTDSAGRVRGIEGLRVCDASLFPTIPCANTNVPTVMCAEKIADAIRVRG